MSDTISIEVPADAPERDLRRVRQEAKVASRNAEIQRQYKSLMEQHTRAETLRQLEQRYPVSQRQIRRIIYGS